MLDDMVDRAPHGIGLDIDHDRLQPRRLGHGHPVVDLLLARGRNQHVDVVGRLRNGPEHLEVEVDFVEGERDVLVGLASTCISNSSSRSARQEQIRLVMTADAERHRDVLMRAPARPSARLTLPRRHRCCRRCRRRPRRAAAARSRNARAASPLPASASSTTLTWTSRYRVRSATVALVGKARIKAQAEHLTSEDSRIRH